jgi:peptidoglycan/xylan/chitin deacetylase (PgdA/CDA1 family)
LEHCGFRTISLTDFVAWRCGQRALFDRCAVLTFDDGFEDFFKSAFPELRTRSWTATVFLPTDVVGGVENWEGALKTSPRKLMSWSQISELKEQGIEFGGHSLTHADLTKLSSEQLQRQVRMSQEAIHQRLGVRATSFAPPYGRSDAQVRNEIRKWYKTSLGVHLQRATQHCDLYDVPRIEMHYFRNVQLWNAFLRRQAEAYFAMRRIIRTVRRIL